MTSFDARSPASSTLVACDVRWTRYASQSEAPSARLDLAHQGQEAEPETWLEYAINLIDMQQEKPHEHRRIFIINHTAISGVHVRCGLRQSIPSSSIDN
jgi:hypothetical protein